MPEPGTQADQEIRPVTVRSGGPGQASKGHPRGVAYGVSEPRTWRTPTQAVPSFGYPASRPMLPESRKVAACRGAPKAVSDRRIWLCAVLLGSLRCNGGAWAILG